MITITKEYSVKITKVFEEEVDIEFPNKSVLLPALYDEDKGNDLEGGIVNIDVSDVTPEKNKCCNTKTETGHELLNCPKCGDKSNVGLTFGGKHYKCDHCSTYFDEYGQTGVITTDFSGGISKEVYLGKRG